MLYSIKSIPRFSFLFLICFFYFIHFSATASTNGAIVYALQMPAWLIHNDIKKPLKPNMLVSSGDTIITGDHARALIHLKDGSFFKIGEHAKINFSKLVPAEEDDGFFEGLIRIKKGAFRFTTPAAAFAKKRNINIEIGSISARITGNDIWGQSVNNEDNLVLIDGVITAQRIGEPEFEMKQSLSWYRIAANEPGKLTAIIPQEKLANWTANTELLSGGGIISTEGRWLVNLISLRNKNDLNRLRLKLARNGYSNTLKEISIKQTPWYRLQIKGFDSKADAKILAQRIENAYGLSKPWILQF